MGELLWAVFVTVGVTMATMLSCIALEHVGPLEEVGWRSRWPGLVMNGVGAGLTVLMMWPINLLWQALGIASVITIPLWTWLAPLGWAGLAIQFLLFAMLADFLAYWRHRFEHRVLWPIHAVHHAPRHLHAANDLGHPLQAFYSLLFIGLPLSLVQFDGPGLPAALATLITMLSIYIHSPVKVHFGPLRKLVVDNRFHRIHHSIEPRHFDKNFSICFSCWDYLFGTAYDPGEEWPDTGLSDVPAPETVRDYLAIPFRLMRRADRSTEVLG